MTKKLYLILILIFTLLEKSSSKVIIVGTGSAGIAAATKLLKNNVTDILILEAENRIGGRINSIKLGNSFVDMGAEWCDGQENNIVYELVKDYDILGHTDLTYSLFYSNGEKVNEHLTKSLFDVINTIYSATSSNKYSEEGVSIGNHCINRYPSAVENLHLINTEEKKIARDFLDYLHHYVISNDGSFSWFDPSAKRDYRNCPGTPKHWNGHGFKTILDVLMQKFPNISTSLPIDDKIIYNKEVKTIVWDSKDNGVIVKCSDGSWYHGDQLIFTPSLGVLKESHRTMFEPSLPQEKQRAIESLGIGAIIKVNLLFSKRWWPEDFKIANLVWSLEHRSENITKFVKDGKTWILDASFLMVIDNNPNVLSFWFTGPSVPYMEKMDDSELLDGINFILDTFFGKMYKLSYPISHVKSRWYTNPHFRGSYSYQTVASRKTTSNDNLAKPVINRNGNMVLMFAGEATHSYFYSTVHGAIETGYREADRVLKSLNVV